MFHIVQLVIGKILFLGFATFVNSLALNAQGLEQHVLHVLVDIFYIVILVESNALMDITVMPQIINVMDVEVDVELVILLIGTVPLVMLTMAIIYSLIPLLALIILVQVDII